MNTEQVAKLIIDNYPNETKAIIKGGTLSLRLFRHKIDNINVVDGTFKALGLCGIINGIYRHYVNSYVYMIVSITAEQHEKFEKYFSGSFDYPIKHHICDDPMITYSSSNNLYTGEYGRRRMLLAGLVIEVINEILTIKSK